MGMTKINAYIGTMLIVLLLSLSLSNLGAKLTNEKDLTDDSISYINTYTNSLNSNSEIAEIETQTINESKNTNFLSNEADEGEQEGTEVFALFRKALKFWDSIIGAVSLFFNLPSFIISGLMLPLESFRTIINVFGWSLVLYIGIMGAKATNLGGRT